LAELVAGVLRRDLATGTAVMAGVISRPGDLGGVPAVSVRLRCQSCSAPNIDWRYVVAINGSRAWIIGLLPSGSAPGALRPILESFRFVDEPTRSADPGTFIEPGGAYRVDLPRGWRAGDEFFPGAVTFFGEDIGGEIVMAVIFLGNPDGSIRLCQFGPCQTVTVHRLDELRAALHVTNPAGYACPGCAPSEDALARAADAVVRPTTLGGEPAEKKRANTSRGWLLGPEMYDWVYAIHDGRPVAIRLDHWPRGGDSGRTEFVESFEFLDGTAGTQTIEFTDAGFTVDVPAGWVVPLWTRSTFWSGQVGGAEGYLRVRVSQDGQLESCRSACRRLPATTLQNVTTILRAEYGARWVAVDAPAVQLTPMPIAGADATSVRIGPPDTFAGRNGPGAGSGTESYAVLFHGGRAIVIGWIPGSAPAGYFGDLLASVRFLD
jgi:hypothetical protein